MKRRRKRPYGKIALLCIVTLIATYAMGRYFETLLLKYGDYNNDVTPVITDPTDNKKNNGEKTEVIYDGLEVFLIQNGVFSVMAGAQSQASALDVQGLKPVIYYDINYRILTGVYLEKEKALSELQGQRDLGFENLLQEVTIPTTKVEVNSEGEKEVVKEIFSAFDKVLAATQGYYSSSQLTKVADLATLKYEGDNETTLKFLEIIELYDTWYSNQTQSNKEQYFKVMVNYIRNVN